MKAAIAAAPPAAAATSPLAIAVGIDAALGVFEARGIEERLNPPPFAAVDRLVGVVVTEEARVTVDALVVRVVVGAVVAGVVVAPPLRPRTLRCDFSKMTRESAQGQCNSRRLNKANAIRRARKSSSYGSSETHSFSCTAILEESKHLERDAVRETELKIVLRSIGSVDILDDLQGL